MKIIKSNLVWILLLGVLITSCEKTELKDGGGKTLVKIKDGGGDPVILAIDVNPPTEVIKIADVRKDAISEVDVNTATTITISNTQAILDSVNAANGTNYVLLPTAAYSFTQSSGVTVNGNTLTITMAPGELARELFINLNKSQLDFSKSYAFGLKITGSSVGSPSLGSGIYIVNVVVKNKYHGLYHSSGVFHHPVNGDRTIDEDKQLLTSGPTSVKANLGDLGGSGYQMILTVNPTTNAVTITPAGVTPNIDQSWGPNYYDPATKSFHLFYSYNVAAPRKIEETITLK